MIISPTIIKFCPGAVAYSRAFFGQGSGPILISGVGCYGPESSLLQCGWPVSSLSVCTHARDAGVRCQGMHVVTKDKLHME